MTEQELVSAITLITAERERLFNVREVLNGQLITLRHERATTSKPVVVAAPVGASLPPRYENEHPDDYNERLKWFAEHEEIKARLRSSSEHFVDTPTTHRIMGSIIMLLRHNGPMKRSDVRKRVRGNNQTKLDVLNRLVDRGTVTIMPFGKKCGRYVQLTSKVNQ